MNLRRCVPLVAAASLLGSAAGAQSASAPAPAPPAINRVNDHLPAWLRVRGEFRERIEGVAGAGFTPERDDAYGLSRFRFDVSARPAPRLLVAVQAQDARVVGKSVGPTGAPFSGAFDLRMAYAQVGDPQTDRLTVRAGRQELAFGEQRLVGHVSWLNTARTFDGARATVRRGSVQVDAFAVSLVRIQPDAFDKSGNGHLFAGAYGAASAWIPRAVVEPYVFWRRDRAITSESGVGALGVATAGARWAGRLPAGFDYGVEMAVQRGSIGADEVAAWAGHWQVRTLLPGPARVRLLSEYNYASGDAGSTDGRVGTFDQLYPTPHDKYGLADQVGWKNIHHLRVGVEVGRWPGWPMNAGYHTWWLAEAGDALYGAGGAPLARVTGGALDRHVGQELDVQVSRMLTPQLQLAAGYAHVFPGGFLEEATPGASYHAPFVMATYVFLADK